MTHNLIEEYRKWSLGRTVECCDEYKYLGLKITRNGTLVKVIKERNTQGKKAILMMNGILCDQSTSKDNKERIYTSIVKNIILLAVKYGR